MSIFSQNNFGLSKSLIDAVKTVNEGKQKYRVSADKGSLAARFLKDAETTLFAKDEKDAANKVMADFKMKGVTQNDLKVTREEFEHANLDEAVRVDTTSYENSHGKKPSGKGAWIFKGGGEEFMAKGNVSFADAKKQAKAWADKKNLTSIQVAESSEVEGEDLQEAMPEPFNTHDKVRIKDTTNPRIKKFAGKEATVMDIEDDGKTVHAKVKGARHGSMEFKASELEKV